MNRKLSSTALLLLCFLLALNGAAVAAAQEDEAYVRIGDKLEVRREVFDIASPSELSVYRVRCAEQDIERLVQYFHLPEGELVENPPYRHYWYNGNVLIWSEESGSVSIYLDGNDNVLKRYIHSDNDGATVRPEEMPGWESELPFMSREEAAKTVEEALGTLYGLEGFEREVGVCAVASSGSEPDCYLVSIDFYLNGVRVTREMRTMFSGWESYGMQVNAAVDERGIFEMQGEWRMYVVEEDGEALPALDVGEALEIYRQAYGDLLIDDCARVEQARLMYIPIPVPGRQNAGKIELRPVWCFQQTFANEDGWRIWKYIDACTGVEYDMQ